MADATNAPRTPKVGFFALMAIFVGSGALLVFFGNHYRGKFGEAGGRVVQVGSVDPIPGAKVRIEGSFDSKYGSSNTSIKIERSTLTDDTGAFRLRETVAGKYTLSVECAGYKRLEREIELGLQEQKDLGILELTPLR